MQEQAAAVDPQDDLTPGVDLRVVMYTQDPLQWTLEMMKDPY